MVFSCPANSDDDSARCKAHAVTAFQFSVRIASRLASLILKGSAFLFGLGLLPSVLSIGWSAGASTMMVFCTPRQATFLLGNSTLNPYRLQTELLSRDYYQQLYRTVGILIENPLVLRQFSRMIAMSLSAFHVTLKAISGLFHPIEVIKFMMHSIMRISPATLRHYTLPPMVTAARIVASQPANRASNLILLFIPLVAFPYTTSSREVVPLLLLQFICTRFYETHVDSYRAWLQRLIRRLCRSGNENEKDRIVNEPPSLGTLDSVLESVPDEVTSCSDTTLLSFSVNLAINALGPTAIDIISTHLGSASQQWYFTKSCRSLTALWIYYITCDSLRIIAANLLQKMSFKSQ